MDRAHDRSRVRLQLDLAMALVRQDRWQLGGVRDGKLKLLADSRPDPGRPFRRTCRLSHLARRCLHERRPLAVSSVAAVASEQAPQDWEMDWPSLLYAPVGMPGQRPVGLLVVGSQTDHWYPQHEIEYVASLAIGLTGLVLSASGPLARLNARELEAARLIAQGLSAPEMSVALQLGVDEARSVVSAVLRKLALRSPGQLADVWPRLESLAGWS